MKYLLLISIFLFAQFSIAQELKVTFPIGGEALAAGGDTTITWKGVDSTQETIIEFSTNYGLNWKSLTNEVSGNAYKWRIPIMNEHQCLVRAAKSFEPPINFLTKFDDKTHKSIELSPDGNEILLAFEDSTIEFWDRKKGILLRSFETGFACRYAGFLPLGNIFIISGSSFKILNMNSGELIHSLDGHDVEINDFALSSDAELFATTSFDSTVKIWNLETGELIHDLKDNTGIPGKPAFDSINSRLVTTSSDHSLRMWNLNSGKLAFTLQGHTGTISKAIFTNSEEYIISVDHNGQIILFDSKTGEIINTIYGHDNIITDINIDNAEKRIVTIATDGDAKVWDISSGELLLKLSGHWGETMWARFSNDGSMILTADNRSFRKWRSDNGSIISEINECHRSVKKITINGQEEILLMDFFNYSPVVKDLVFGNTKHVLNLYSKPEYIAFQEEGDLFCSFHEYNSYSFLCVYNAFSGKMLHNILTPYEKINMPVFNPNAKQIFIRNAYNESFMFNLETEETYTIIHQYRLKKVFFSDDGKNLVTLDNNNCFIVRNSETGNEIFGTENINTRIDDGDISSDGRYLAAACYDNLIRIWDISSRKIIRELDHGEWVKGCCFSPDDSLLASYTSDKKIRIWNFFTGRLKYTFDIHNDYVECLKFSDDGSLLASWGDEEIYIWNTLHGGLKKSCFTENDIIDFDFHPGNKLISYSSYQENGVIRNIEKREFSYKIDCNGGYVERVVFTSDSSRLLVYNHYKDKNTGKIHHRIACHNIDPQMANPWSKSSDIFSVEKPVIIFNDIDLGDVDNNNYIKIIDQESFLNNPTIFHVRIDSIKFICYPQDLFKITSFNAPSVLNPFEKMDAKLKIITGELGPIETDVTVYTQCDTMSGQLKANIVDSRFEFFADSVDFGEVEINRSKDTLCLFFENVTDKEIQINEISCTNPLGCLFSILDDYDTNILKPGDTLKLLLSFFPMQENEFRSYLEFKFVVPFSLLHIPLKGKGVLPEKVDDAKRTIPSFSVYPNPAVGSAVLAVTADAPGPADIALYDLLGRKLRQAHRGMLVGGRRFTLDTRSLAPGAYYVLARFPGKTETKLLQVVR